MTEQDLTQALSVLGDALGRRYISKDELRTYAGGEEGRHALVAQQESGPIVGAATGLLLDHDQFVDLLPEDMRLAAEDVLPNLDYQCLGILKSIAVTTGAEGRGIGTSLAQGIVQRLWDEGATYIVAIGWTDAAGCHIKGVLEGLGFKQVGLLENFWTNDSKSKDYDCPSCGQPCTCAAMLFGARRSDLLHPQPERAGT